jgi:hypothetical protein
MFFAASRPASRARLTHPAAAQTRRRTKRTNPPVFLPRFEILEDRWVPSTITWTGPSGGSWGVPANWSSHAVPGPADDVQINSAVTVNHSSGTDSVHSLTSVAGSTVNVTGGSLALGAASTLGGDFNLTFATLQGPGALTVGGLFTWSGGVIQGGGAVTANGGMTINGSSVSEALVGRPLTTAGTVTWSGTANTIELDNGAVWNNAGTLNAATDNTMTFGGPTCTFKNTGTFNKSGGTGTTAFLLPVINSGTVNAQSGTISFQGNGTTSGSAAVFTAAAGAHVEFLYGTYTLGGGTTLTGAGTIDFNGATVKVAGAVTDDAATTTFSLGTLTGAGVLTVNNTLTWTGGTMSGTGSTVINARNVGGTLVQAVLNLDSSAGAETLDGRTLTLKGQINWTGNASSFNLYKGALLSILKGTITSGATTVSYTGTFTILNDTFIDSGGATSKINNQGAIIKSGGTGTTAIYPVLVNSGTVTVSSGQLSLQGGGTNTKTITVAATASLEFPNTPYNLGAGTSITGAGTILIDGGTVDVLANVTVAVLTQFSSGTITGGGTVTFSKELDWTGGFMAGDGATVTTGPLKLSGDGGTEFVDGRSLTNKSAASTWTGSGNTLDVYDGAVFTNSGTLTVQGDDYLFNGGGSATPSAVNSGTLKTSGLGASLTISLPLTNSNTISVGNNTTVTLSGGGSNTKSLTVGSGTGPSGAVLDITTTPFVLNTGTVASGPGELRVDQGGTLDVNATALTISAARVSLGTAAGGWGAITGVGALTITKELDWTAGGIMDGAGSTTIAAAGTLKIFGDNTYEELIGRTLNVAGSATWSGTFNTLYLEEGAALNVPSGGTFTAQNDEQIAPSGATATFNNAGTFTKSAGAGGSAATVVGVPFNNTGTVNVNTGTLQLSAGGTGDGTFTVASLATLDFEGGYVTTLTHSGNAITGAGNVTFGYGEVDLTGYSITGGTTVTGTAHVSANSATATFTSSGTMIISDGATYTVTGGDYNQTAGDTYLNGATLAVAAGHKVNLQASANFYGQGTVNGTFQNAGILWVGGSYAIGRLTVNGNYTQTSTGNLYVELSGTVPGTSFDKLTINGTATLNSGSGVSVYAINGYLPPSGTPYTFMTYTSRVGDFTNFSGAGSFSRTGTTYTFTAV